MQPFIFVGPASRGLGLALTRHLLATTKLPIYATHRSGSPEDLHAHILSPLSKNVGVAKDTSIDPARLRLLKMDLTQEESISAAANQLEQNLKQQYDGKKTYLHTAFFTGGVLHPERSPSDLDVLKLQETFQINTISHLLAIKHFSRFLPPARTPLSELVGTEGLEGSSGKLARWVHVSARVGSVSDNKLGGWYSYRASKAALNQIVKTFDLQLQQKRIPAVAVGVHPGTVRTDFSREFWGGVKEGKLFEPEYAAERLVEVVNGLEEKQRGRIWDWRGEEVTP
jgi:NAD(P)-dependent dehydrogenase (short-subunit alcohol dehydrogenase family)